ACDLRRGAKAGSQKDIGSATAPATVQRVCCLNHWHDPVGDRHGWAVQFSPRLVLSHLRADNGCLRSGFYYRLPPGDVSSGVSAKAEFGPQLARLVVIGGATLVRRYRLRSGSAADALHPGAATNCTLVSGWLAHRYHPI